MDQQNYIDGAWVRSADGQTFEQRNPADLDQVTGIWPKGTRDDAQKAIESAHAAFPEWAGIGVYQRAAYLSRAVAVLKGRIEEIAATLTQENGKTLAESRSEVGSAVREMEYQIAQGLSMCGETAPSAEQGVFAYSVRRPLGVASIISPWNFPFNVPGRKCTPALISGNTIVFKPASLTPGAGKAFVDVFVEAGLPPGGAEFRLRRGEYGRGRDDHESAGAVGVLYGIDGGWQGDPAERGPDADPHPVGDGRQKSSGGLRRRRPRQGGGCGRQGGLCMRWAVVHVDEPGDRG